MSELHVYGDDCEWVIAASVEDAKKVWCEFVGEDTCDIEFERLPDDKTISILCDTDGNPDDREAYAIAVKKTASEWAKRGRGYLCTTEY